jgi:REP element-mobilizing transposase RayT
MYNPEKHHRRSVRLKNHSYNDGFYFVTICCENRSCIFGKIKDGIMTPNDYGKIAQKEWSRTAEIRSNNVKLHGFIAMPNHIHGILEINNTTTVTIVGARRALPSHDRPPNHDYSLPSNKDLQSAKRFQNQGRNTLSSIVGSYKSAVSKQIHEIGFIGSVWQRNYHESVICDMQSYQNKSQYIINNPANWQKDEFYSNA